MLFDNLSLLSDVLKNASSVISFLRQLQISVRAKGIHPKLVSLFCLSSSVFYWYKNLMNKKSCCSLSFKMADNSETS